MNGEASKHPWVLPPYAPSGKSPQKIMAEWIPRMKARNAPSGLLADRPSSTGTISSLERGFLASREALLQIKFLSFPMVILVGPLA